MQGLAAAVAAQELSRLTDAVHRGEANGDEAQKVRACRGKKNPTFGTGKGSICHPAPLFSSSGDAAEVIDLLRALQNTQPGTVPDGTSKVLDLSEQLLVPARTSTAAEAFRTLRENGVVFRSDVP